MATVNYLEDYKFLEKIFLKEHTRFRFFHN